MSVVIIVLLLAVFAMVAWRDLKLALILILGLLPAYLLRFEMVIPWTALEGFILIAFTVWFFGYNGRKLDLRTLGKYRAPLFFLLAMATFATIWAPDQARALGVWKAYFIEPMLMLVMLRTTFIDRQDWVRALIALSLTTIAIAIFAIFQKLTGLGLPIPWDVERRATSIFEYPNAVGLFVAPIVSALIVAAMSTGHRSARTSIMMLVGAALGMIAIISAETEAALVAIPVALLGAFAISQASRKTKIAVLAGSAIVGIVLFAAVPMVREKVLLQDYSGGVRRSQWSETIDLLQDKPIQGAGLSGYPTVFEPYHDPTLYEIFQYPHNVILNFWVEMGIFGVIAFLWITIVTCKLAWARRHDRLVLAAFAALLTMTIHGLVDVPFFKNDLAVLTAFFLAMMLVPANTSSHLDSSS